MPNNSLFIVLSKDSQLVDDGWCAAGELSLVDVDGGVAVKMEDTEHSGDSCVALVAGELERILRSSLYEHAQKNS